MVCGNCHARITGGDIDIHQVFRAKLRLQRGEVGARLRRADRPASNVIRFQARTNSGIVANNLQIHTTNKRIKVEPPAGTISADRDKLNYIKHLIKRYNGFRKSDPATPNFSYAVIYKSIEKEFKCEWAYVPLSRFAELASYLQRRIDGTRLGRINASKGSKSCSSFADFQSKMT